MLPYRTRRRHPGTGILLVGCPAVAFVCGTAAPLAERFRDLNNLISPVSLIFLAAYGISAPPSVVDNYTDLLYHFSKACQATKYDKRSILHRTRKICNNLGNRRRIKGCIKINNPTKKKAPDGISLRGRYGRGRACPARGLPIRGRWPSCCGPHMCGPYRAAAQWNCEATQAAAAACGQAALRPSR